MASTSLQDKMKLAAGSFAANDFESALSSFQECLTLTTNEKALRIIQTNIGATFQRMSRFDEALFAALARASEQRVVDFTPQILVNTA